MNRSVKFELKTPFIHLVFTLFDGEPYDSMMARRDMERFAVKRGIEKSMGGNAGLCKKAAEYFDNISATGDGQFTGSFGIMTKVVGSYEDGKLVVEVEQMKGDELGEFLASDGGRELAMESRKRWSSFLDIATGYTAKQRGDKAKEDAKKLSKAKSAINMAKKSMELIENVEQEKIDAANSLIEEIQSMLDGGQTPPESKVKKLNDLF
jgi:hypothetical protein